MARIPDDTRDAVAADLRAGELSVRAIATKHDVSPTSVSAIGRDIGVEAAGRAQTQNATEARLIDYRAKRAQIREQLARDTIRLQAQLWQPCVMRKFGGKDNTLGEVDLPEPTFEDKRNIMTTIGIAVDKMAVLDRADAEADQGKATGGLLERLVDSLEDRKAARESA